MSLQELTLPVSASRRVTAYELVRDTVRTAILRGDLPGGTRLVQTDLARQIGVSTTPVREAMRDLASAGIISLDNHRIGTVRSPAWEEMVEIVQIRRSLEEVAITRAISCITQSELRRAAAVADELAEEEDLGSWVLKNSEFHSIFHMATQTKRLGAMLVNLEEAGGVFVAQAQRFHPEIRSQAIADHYALLEAYEAKDADRAVEIQLEHIDLPLRAVDLDATA